MAKQKKNLKSINETWSPMIQKTTGVTNPEKLAWMSEMAHVHAVNEAENWGGGAIQGNPGAMGGVFAPYQTLYNTVGIGNPVPAGRPALTGADYADNANIGSGDKWPSLLPIALKVAAKTIGLELVNVTPLQGPTGALAYMDYVYSGSKQPWGATPAHDPMSANPHYFQQGDAGYKDGAWEPGTNPAAFQLYGLPHTIKLSLIGEPADVIKARMALKEGIDEAGEKEYAPIQAGDNVIIDGGKLNLQFVGWSRIDGDPIFKVLNGTAPLGETFGSKAALEEGLKGAIDATHDVEVKGKVENKAVYADAAFGAPKLVSMLEDHIQGFAGSGRHDSDPWFGTYQDGTRLYEPMSRATGELQYARQVSLQLFSKNVNVGTISAGAAVTQEMVQDLQKQWGIDAMKMVENAAINELSQTINRHITSRLFALGWKNHCKLVEVEGPMANLNLTYATADMMANGLAAKMTKAYAIPQGEFNEKTQMYDDQTNIALPFRPLYMVQNAAFENKDTLMKRLYENFLKASNWILQRGRYGAGTFAVTNLTVATQLQTNSQYSFSPFQNNISQQGGALYNLGSIAGLQIYVDPLMAANDCRVLVGRKGGKDEAGVHYCPYIMAESCKIISEGTMAPKVVIKSRYALVDVGFFPETQYITFVVDFAGLV